jgi:hypothetical protein
MICTESCSHTKPDCMLPVHSTTPPFGLQETYINACLLFMTTTFSLLSLDRLRSLQLLVGTNSEQSPRRCIPRECEALVLVVVQRSGPDLVHADVGSWTRPSPPPSRTIMGESISTLKLPTQDEGPPGRLQAAPFVVIPPVLGDGGDIWSLKAADIQTAAIAKR